MNKTNPNEIHPVFDKIVNKAGKEKLLKQKAKVVWLTGLLGSGKTTLGAELEKALYTRGYLTQVLDGDNIRTGINRNLKFTEEDRLENIRRIAEVTKLFLNCGVIAIDCFITPTESIRQIARDIIGRENIVEVFINASIETCESRDTKGLYKKARAGEIKNFTGIDSPFEIPEGADVILDTNTQTIEESAKKLLEFVLKQVKYKE